MEQAADKPEQYILPDEFNGGVQAKKQQLSLFGRERFKFTTNSKDEERINVCDKTVKTSLFVQEAAEQNKICDTQPLNITEVRAWNLRPRSKDLEIGPAVRFKPKVQMERIYDQLTSQVSPVFTDKALN